MIKDIIYHILNKKQYSSEGILDINPNQLIPNDSHRKFLDQLNKADIGRAGKGYGIFNENEDIYPMYNRQNEMSKISKRNVQKKREATKLIESLFLMGF